ncbi:MAG: NADAR domain-containing protein [Alistipes sp.]|nr:NADAR domain-containing protein [Alistipes sp.]
MRESKIQYNPLLSVKENAKRNNVTVAAIRYYIKVNNIDRRFDRTQNLIADCREYLRKHPKATKTELHKKTGYSLSTIRIHWDYISGEKEWTNFDSEKIEKNLKKKQDTEKRQKAYLDKLPIEFIRDYLKNREESGEPKEADSPLTPPKYELVKILDGIEFKPFEEFRIPVKECIQFHSKALPENKVLSNHYDCIIRFRDCEFFSLEQMFLGLTYSDSIKIMREVMNANSGIKAKKLCREKYADRRDWNFEEKRYRIIALCHLYKYLSVKEYRDRLRETYPQTLVESPNGKDFHFGMVQNLETNIFEGNNCSGRTTMIVRDMMLKLENEAIKNREGELGRTLTVDEREAVVLEVCEKVRRKYDTDKNVLRDSRQLFKFIEKENIPKIKKRRPTPMEMPVIDRSHRCLVLDFDMTIFDTSVDDAYRKCSGKKDMDKAFELIPEYKLYEGFEEVFDWCKNNRTKIAVLSGASKNLIETTFAHFKIPYDVIIGYQPYIEKPNPILGNMLMEKLNLREEQIVYVGDSLIDDIQARSSKFRFYGSTWSGRENDLFETKGIPTIDNPTDIIPLLEAISIEEPSVTKPVAVVEKKPTKKKQTKEAKADKKPKKINTTIRCTDSHVYFYQNTPLSNWWVSEPAIPYDNHTFTSTESLFMYLKAKVFRDDVMAERIANAHFDDAKKLGRLIQNFSDEVWERERENAMYIAIKAKLTVDEVFRDTLLSEEYKGKIFVEASPTDKVWGIRRSISEAYQGKEWRGLNLLGKLLTELRDEMLGLIQPKEREITPINPDEIKTIEPVKAVPSKNTYSTDGVMVRSILGGIIGDIAGSSREGYSKNVLSPRKILTAQSYFTDDSILTVAVADWLNNQDKTTLKDCLIKWHSRYPHAGFGKLFDRFAETGEAQESNGNGGAMRVAPCGVLAKTIEEAVSLAEQQCIVSHTTDVAINGAKAIAAAVFIAKDGASKGKTDVEIKQDVKSYVEEHYGYNLNMTLEEIQAQSVELAKQREAFRRDGIESPSYLNMSNAFLSCPMAITAFLLGKNYEEAIRYALAMMGDADTIACMAGCISAQVYGIPQQLIEDALVYLPIEMIDVLNEFEPENNFEPSGITPPVINKWTEKAETVVYGSGDEQNENGGAETIASRFNPHPRFGYAIPTIGKSIEEIQDGVNVFIEYAKNNPDMRFHVRKVGYDKAGYTVEQIAPLFSEARAVRNILLPKAIVDALD